MLRFLLTPRWLAAHAAFILAVAFCVVAGWWQSGAYQDSQSRHEDRDRPPVPMSQLVGPGEDIGAAADHPVTATGVYLTDHQLLMPGRIHEDVLGWFAVVPLEVSDGTIVPVVRGWVEDPADATSLATPPITVTGYLLPPETPDHATVRSGQVLEDYELAYVAPDTLQATTELPAETMVQGYLLMSAEEPDMAGVALLDINEVAPIRNVNPWQNLSYWAQWWLFAVAALVFWASAVRAGIRSRRAKSEPETEPETISEPEPRHVPS